jgi:aspartyl-tRNA(Asn)/glutamyl-tRNA(Gln) amidotransferase subunit A
MIRSLYDAHLDLKNKKMSSVELTQECLSKAKNAKNNTYITLTEDLALSQAKERDTQTAKSYLHGIPFSLKDLFVTKGIRTTAGSLHLFNYIPPYEGTVSRYLHEAGGVLMGKVGCDEFGMGSTNEKTAFGPVLNPLNPSHVAGGSSGGSAASVAEGSALYSIGTDTGGSVRLPSYFCGLAGLKPTYGRITRYGQIAYASSLDQASPMAKTTMDLACILSVLTQKDSLDNTNYPEGPLDVVESLSQVDPSFIKGKKIGYNEELVSGCDKDVEKTLREVLAFYQKSGAKLINIEMPHFKYAVAVYYIIATSEASSNLARFDGIHYGYRHHDQGSESLEATYQDSRSFGLHDEVKKRILLGTFSLSTGFQDQYFAQACKVRRLIAEDYQKAFSLCDVFFSPVCSSRSFKLKEGSQDALKMYLNDIYTIPASLAGIPSLSIPAGDLVNNLPTGFQLTAGAHQEEKLLSFARAFEVGGR